MRLTQYMRTAFIKAVMDDVPCVDYEAQAAKVMMEYAASKLPPKVKAVWNDNATRGYIDVKWARCCGFNADVPDGAVPPEDSATYRELERLRKLKSQQDETRSALRNKLRAAAYSVTTSKALIDLLPEFKKYIPADAQPPDRTVPVVANLVADLVAAGWPKDKKPTLKAVKK